ncbi:MAG: methyltransferase domain-containing protein [Candidatus Methanoperedens sp.]
MNLEKKYFLTNDIVNWWDPEEKASFSEYLGANDRIKVLLTNILDDIFLNLDFENKRVLDAGIGKGRFSVNIARNGAAEIIGLDINKKMILLTLNRIKEMELDKQIKLTQGDIEQLPISNQKFDIVCCVETLIHIPNLDKAIKEFSRVLKKDGRLVVNVPPQTSYLGYLEYCSIMEIIKGFFKFTKQRIIMGKKNHTQFVSKKSFEKLLFDSGFRIEKKINYGKYFTILTTYICEKNEV